MMTIENEQVPAKAPETPPATDNTGDKTGGDSGSTDREAKRDALRAKIEASERRIAERSFTDQAKEAAGNATEYTKKHPFVVIGGALAFGLLIGALSRPGRRLARNAALGTAGLMGTAAAETRHAGRVARNKTSRFGDMLSDALAVYSAKLMDGAVDSAHASQDALEDFGDAAERKARALRREAGYYAGNTADSARFASRRTRRRASRAVRDIRGR